MRILAILGAVAIAFAATACGSDEPGGSSPGGSGGIGGSGGTGAAGGTGGTGGSGGTGGTGGVQPDPRMEACALFCDAYDACGYMPDDDAYAACIDDCMGSTQFPDELYAACGTCLAGLECSEIETSTACNEACSLASFDVTVEGTGFAAGNDGWLVLLDDQGEFIDFANWTLDAPTFTQRFEQAVIQGFTYSLVYWIDADANGVCSAGDHMGVRQIPAVMGDVTVALDADAADDVAACQMFAGMPVDLHLTGSAPAEWAGAELIWLLADPANEPIAGNALPIEGDTVDVLLPELLDVGEAYRFSYFVDVNANRLCDEGDHAASFEIPAVTGHVTLDRADEVALAMCTGFDWVPGHLTITGAGFADYEGKTVVLSVAETIDGERTVLGSIEATIADGAFASEPIDNLLAIGADYDVSWLIDLDEDGSCSPAPADIGGAVAVTRDGAHGAATIEAPAEPTSADCASFPGMGFDITVEGSGFAAHAGKYFELFLVDAATGAMLAVEWGDVAGDTLSVTFDKLGTLGASYTVALFVDTNGSLYCDGTDPSGYAAAEFTVDGAETITVAAPTAHDAAACEDMNAYWAF